VQVGGFVLERLTHDSSIYGALAMSEMKELHALAYLGTVTPAFSQAWIRAEPAVVIVNTSLTTQDPIWHTFYRDLLAIYSTRQHSLEPRNLQTQFVLPTVSWTSACRLLLVANVLEALQLCLLARRAERASDCRNIVFSLSSQRKGEKQRGW
jgi:hypothetical protein